MKHDGVAGKMEDMQGTVLYAAGPGVRVERIGLYFGASEAPVTLTGPRRVMLLRSYFGPGFRGINLVPIAVDVAKFNYFLKIFSKSFTRNENNIMF